MAAKLRGRCRYCGRRYVLTKAGKIRKHSQRGHIRPELCGGSGQIPA